MSQYIAGYASRVINPTLPTNLAGYNVNRISNHIHDSLFARIVILQDPKDESAKLAIISLDTLIVDETFTKLVSSRLLRYGFEPHQIIVSATHTHSGASGLAKTDGSVLAGMNQVFGTYDESYVKHCLEQIEWAIYEVSQNLQEADIVHYKGQLKGVCGNRHSRGKPDQLVDSINNHDEYIESIPVNCIEIQFKCYQPVLIYSFACHPTILNANNTSVSADLCYGIEQVLMSKDQILSTIDYENKKKNQFGMVVFLNGAAGDQSTRMVRYESTFDEVRRIGELVGKQLQKILCNKANIIKEWQSLTPLISTQIFEYPVSLATLPTLEEANKQILLYQNILLKKQKEVSVNQWQRIRRIYETGVEGAKIRAVMAEHLTLESVIWRIMKVRIGAITLITVPGELYESLAKHIKLAEGFVCGYTNGYYLYIVDELAFEELDYEAMMSPYEKGEGERFVEFINEVVLKE